MKSLLALRDVGRESEAESVRFYGRRVTKAGPEVKDGFSIADAQQVLSGRHLHRIPDFGKRLRSAGEGFFADVSIAMAHGRAFMAH